MKIGTIKPALLSFLLSSTTNRESEGILARNQESRKRKEGFGRLAMKRIYYRVSTTLP